MLKVFFASLGFKGCYSFIDLPTPMEFISFFLQGTLKLIATKEFLSKTFKKIKSKKHHAY
jgi:hypothetical protein